MCQGFSLVELSIVLVILGLLTGGILAGQSLIRAAELRAVSNEYQRYTAAIYSFRDKYSGVPGDFRDATRFWNRQAATPDCVSNSGLTNAGSPGACDGDGNAYMTSATAASQSGEEYQAWRQLGLAGLIEGNYTGLAGSEALDSLVAGVNVPAGRLSSSIWRIRSLGDTTGAVTGSIVSTFALSYGGILEGGMTRIGGAIGLLKPEEVWNLDVKLDDGMPAGGRIIARPWSTCSTASARTDLAASYALNVAVNGCQIIFRNQF